jgi:hypothetical protein
MLVSGTEYILDPIWDVQYYLILYFAMRGILLALLNIHIIVNKRKKSCINLKYNSAKMYKFASNKVYLYPSWSYFNHTIETLKYSFYKLDRQTRICNREENK